MPDKKPIGMLYLDCTKLKQVLMPSPLKCLDVSELMYIKLATLYTELLFSSKMFSLVSLGSSEDHPLFCPVLYWIVLSVLSCSL